jgi:nucleoid DNA-binding protein
MSQEELIAALSERSGLSRQTVQEIMEEIGKIWGELLLEEGRLSVADVGEFVVDHQPGRKAVNLDTRELLMIPPQDVIAFFPAAELLSWSNRAA